MFNVGEIRNLKLLQYIPVCFKKITYCISLKMSRSLRNKRTLTDKINSNAVETNERVVKKRKHLTIKTDSNEETSNPEWNPPDWKSTVENIRKMRKDTVAPVDDMGCDKAADLNESPEVCTHLLFVQNKLI